MDMVVYLHAVLIMMMQFISVVSVIKLIAQVYTVLELALLWPPQR